MDARIKPGHDAECEARISATFRLLISHAIASDSLFKQPCTIARGL
jgi:hypothetical protein